MERLELRSGQTPIGRKPTDTPSTTLTHANDSSESRARIAIDPWLAGWAICLWIGVLAVAVYQNAPGRDAEPPLSLPGELATMAPPDKASAWMTMHPECPCTEASLAELSDLVRVHEQRLAAYVLLVVPEERRETWSRTAYARLVEEDPRIELVVDHDGRLASSLGATTSGRVALYGADRRLLFHGGITPSRAHRGESAGKDAIHTALAPGSADAPIARTSAFGCDLFDADQAEGCCTTDRPITTPAIALDGPHERNSDT